MTIRNYTSAAPSTSLTGAVTNVATTITVASSSGYPAVPFVAIINRDLGDEEAVLVTNVAGTTWTVTRGFDGTTALSHLGGAKVEHGVTAIEFREANAHNNAVGDTHGISGNIKSYIDTADTANSSALTAHGALTTGTHGLTSVLSRLTATEGVANSASSTATTANSTANTATTNLSNHIANGTGVHGVSGNLSSVISSGDQARYCSTSRSTQVSLTSGAAATSIGMTAETDANGWHAANTADIVPTEAGMYLITAGGAWEINNTGWRGMQIIVNNGSTIALAQSVLAADTTTFQGLQQNLSAVCYANGTTDFFALQAAQYNLPGNVVHLNSAYLTVTRLGS